MTLQSPPYVISAASHGAALFRQAFDCSFQRRGAMAVGEWATTQQATPNMSVQIGPGRLAIPGTLGSSPGSFGWSTQGSYFAENDASATVTIAASNATNPRIDVVYVAVQDAFYSGSGNQVVLAVATGVASASPTVPAIPSNAIAIAQIAVAANATTIVNANISQQAGLATSLAVSTGGILPVATTVYPANPYRGQYVDDAALGLVRYDGSAWQQFGLGGDTGWQSLVPYLASGFVAGPANPNYRIRGGVVYFTGDVARTGGTSFAASTNYVVATPPAACNPNSTDDTVSSIAGSTSSVQIRAYMSASTGLNIQIGGTATATVFLSGMTRYLAAGV